MGITVALTAAFFWALSARFYGQSTAQWSVLVLNFAKNFIAVLVLATCLWLLPINATANMETALILLLSGVIGIGLGDTALLASLNRIGEQNTLLIAETLAPFIVITLGVLVLSETLTWLHYGGIFLVLLATDLAIGWRHQKRLDMVAVMFAVTAACCQATGALISRYYLSTTELGVLESAVWRLAGGLLFTVVGLALLRMSKQTIRFQTLNQQQSVKLLVAIFLGTVIGVFMLQWSLDLLSAGLAQTLLACSPLFAVLIAWLNRESISRRQVAAVFVGLIGVAVIAFA